MGIAALNTHSQDTITYTDNRSPDVIFSTPGSAQDLNFTLLGYTFLVQRSIDIAEIIRPEITDVVFEVDVSAVAGTTVTWSTIPAGCSTSETAGVYSIDGIDTVETWETVRAPTIQVPTTFNGSFIYTCTIRYTTSAGIQTQSWDVGNFIPVGLCQANSSVVCDNNYIKFHVDTTYSATTALTASLSQTFLVNATETDWYASQTNTITGAPDLLWDGVADTWNVSITPSNTAIVSDIDFTATLPSVTTSFNPTTKVFDMSGSLSDINDALDTLEFTATSTKADFTFTYSAYRDGDVGSVYTKVQSARCMNLQYLTDARGTATYTTATPSLIGTSSPTILDPDYTGTGSYTVTIAPQNPANVTLLSSDGFTDWGVEQTYTMTVGTGDALENSVYASTNSVLVMSDIQDDTNTTNGGAVYWFQKTDLEWTMVKSLFGPFGSTYGKAIIAADDDTVIFSDHAYNSYTGRALVMTTTGNPANPWSLNQTLSTPSGDTPTSGDAFGNTISASRDGNVVAIGKPHNQGSTGGVDNSALYIYRRTETVTTDGLTPTEFTGAITSDESKFGGASAVFDGANDYLVLPNTTFSSDFTVEGWFYPDDTQDLQVGLRIGHYTGVDWQNELVVQYRGSSAGSSPNEWSIIYAGGSHITSTSGSYTGGQWYHIAVSRSGTTSRIFINGTLVKTNTSDSFSIGGNTSTDNITIGYANSGGIVQYFNGYVDEVRFSDSARYTAAFTPATTAFSNDANTVFLWHADSSTRGSYYLSATAYDSVHGASDGGLDWATDVVMAPSGRVMYVSHGFGRKTIFRYDAGAWTTDVAASGWERVTFTSDGEKYMYCDGGDIYLYSRSGSTWSQTTTFTPSITIDDNEKIHLSLDDTKLVVQGDGTGATDFVVIDFDTATNTFTESFTDSVSSEMTSVTRLDMNHDGSEIILSGILTGGSAGFVTYTFGPKQFPFNTSTKTLTMTGTKTFLQTDIDTIKLTTPSGVITDIVFDVSVETPLSNTQTKTFTAINT